MPYKLLGHVLKPTCVVVIRKSGTGGGWRQMENCGGVGPNSREGCEIIQHRMVILMLCSATKHSY